MTSTLVVVAGAEVICHLLTFHIDHGRNYSQQKRSGDIGAYRKNLKCHKGVKVWILYSHSIAHQGGNLNIGNKALIIVCVLPLWYDKSYFRVTVCIVYQFNKYKDCLKLVYK